MKLRIEIKCIILVFVFNILVPFVLVGQDNYYQLARSYAESGNYQEAIRLMKLLAEQEKDTEYYIDDIATIAGYYSKTDEIDSIVFYNAKLQNLIVNSIHSNDSIGEEYIQFTAWNYYQTNQYALAIEAAEWVLSLRENLYGKGSSKWFEWIGVMSYEAFMFNDLEKMKEYINTESYTAEIYHGVNSDYFKDVVSMIRGYAHQLVSQYPQFTTTWILPYYHKICDADILPILQYEFEIILMDGFILMDDLKSASIYADKIEKKARFGNEIPVEDRVRLFLKSAYYDLQIRDNIKARFTIEDSWKLLQKENLSPSISMLIDRHRVELGLRMTPLGEVRMYSEWIFETSTSIIESNIKEPETIAFFYESRSAAYQHDGNYEKAIHDLKSAIALVPLVHRKNRLAQLYMGNGDYENAEALYLALYGDSTIDNVHRNNIISDIVFLYWQWGKLSELETFIELDFKNMKTKVRKTFSYMNEEEREIFLTNSILGSTIPYDLYTYYSNEKQQWKIGNKYAYNLALIQKGLLLSTINDIDDILMNAPESMDSLIKEYEKLKVIEDPLWHEDFAKDVRMELMKYVVEQPEFLSQLDYTWEDVRKSLSNEDVAIEFINLCGMKPGENIENAKPSLGALILREFDTSPIFVNLGEVEYIDSLFGYVEYGVKLNDIIYSGEEKKKLYQKIWQPLLPYLEGCTNVFYSPTGILYEINLDYIGNDDYDMICDSLNLYRLSSTRELCKHNYFKPKDSAILYGNIAYSLDIPDMDNYSVPKYRSTTRAGFVPLKGTAVEIDSVMSNFIAHGYNSHSFYQEIATETSFRELSGKAPSIIHLATHGFYYSKESIEKELQYANYIAFQYNKSDLYHSGLALSGAQDTWVNNNMTEEIDFGKYFNMDQNSDGILLSAEISQLDLSNVDLVVLSACETALGEIRTDGVFGLQRGFKLAGVNSIIMSLWKVDDDATQILMNHFYKKYLDGVSKREALIEAQKVVRETPGYEDPYYWAAFVLLDGLN